MLTTRVRQVVTLHAGTNDVFQNYDVVNAPSRLMRLMDQIFSASPNATIIVSSIIALPSRQQAVDTYNTQIERLVKERIAKGERVVWVSMAAVVPSDLGDGIHPNAGGYAKMGKAFYGGWITARERGWLR